MEPPKVFGSLELYLFSGEVGQRVVALAPDGA